MLSDWFLFLPSNPDPKEFSCIFVVDFNDCAYEAKEYHFFLVYLFSCVECLGTRKHIAHCPRQFADDTRNIGRSINDSLPASNGRTDGSVSSPNASFGLFHHIPFPETIADDTLLYRPLTDVQGRLPYKRNPVRSSVWQADGSRKPDKPSGNRTEQRRCFHVHPFFQSPMDIFRGGECRQVAFGPLHRPIVRCIGHVVLSGERPLDIQCLRRFPFGICTRQAKLPFWRNGRC